MVDYIDARESELPGCPPVAVVRFMNRYEDMLDAWAQVSDSWDRAKREHVSRRCSGTPQSTPQLTPQLTSQSTPNSTPKSTPNSTPQSTPKPTPQSTPQYTQQSPVAQQRLPPGSKNYNTRDLRRILGLDQSNDPEDLALIDRLSILKAPQPIRLASENSSQLGLKKSKYATQTAPAVPGARLQDHNVVPDKVVPNKTPPQNPGPVPTNLPSNIPAAPEARLQGQNLVLDKTPSKKPGSTFINTRPHQTDRIADKRRNLEGRWDATKAENFYCHESQRPGGHAPWAPFLNDNNQDSVRDARYLNLCHDEQLKACMNMYGRGSGCRHANKPQNCPNNHEVKPWQLQWLVENRNLHPDVAFYMIHYYNQHRPRHSLALEKLPCSVQPGIAGAGVPITNPPEAKDFRYKSIEAKEKSKRPGPAGPQQGKPSGGLRL